MIQGHGELCCRHLRRALEEDPLILPGRLNVPALCLVTNRARSDSSARLRCSPRRPGPR